MENVQIEFERLMPFTVDYQPELVR